MSTGHIKPYKGKNGAVSYQLVVELPSENGKRIRRYKTVKGTKKQAKEALRMFQNELETGYTVTPASMKLSLWMDTWLTQYCPNIEATTRDGYRDKIKNQINAYLGNTQLKALNPVTIQTWVNKLHKEKGLAPKTIRNAFNILNPALEKAVVTKLIPSNPCKGVVLPKGQKYNATIYSTQEIKNLLKIAEGTDMYLILLLTCYVGFRRGELLALKWDHIDFEKGIIHIQDNTVRAAGTVSTKAPKSAAGTRSLTVGSNIITALKAARAQYNSNKLAKGAGFTDSGLVVCQKDGKPFRPDSMTQKWGRFVKQHDLKPVRFHDLRHSCATMMIEAGIDPKTVQTRIGHADISTTMNIYAHCTKTMDQGAAKTIDKILFA